MRHPGLLYCLWQEVFSKKAVASVSCLQRGNRNFLCRKLSGSLTESPFLTYKRMKAENSSKWARIADALYDGRRKEIIMTENLKDFLKKASENEELQKKLESLKDEKDMEKIIGQTVKIARDAGFGLSDSDFRTEKMDDEEMAQVSGGWKICFCIAGGGGKEDADGCMCFCIEGGAGERKDSTNNRCICVHYGFGKDSNLPAGSGSCDHGAMMP